MGNKFVKLLIIAFLFRAILAFVGFHPDVNNHVDWGIRFFSYGPAKFYAPESNVWNYTWPNQPPGTIYIFALVRKLYEFLFSIFWWINIKVPPFPSILMTWVEDYLYIALLKLPSVLADLGIAALIYKMLDKKYAFRGSIFWLFNPVVIYNSAIWGQTDSIISFFGLFAFYLLLTKKLVWAVVAFALCLYIKLSLAIFAPIFVIMALRQKYEVKDYVKAVIFSLVIIGVLTLPFSHREPFGYLYKIYTDKVLTQQLHVITANAFNIWAALTGIHEQPHTLPFLGLTYQYWGDILFAIFFVPILFLVYKKQNMEVVVIGLMLTAFSSFMFLTNMHERYLYPVFPFLTILVVKQRKLLPVFIGVSLISLLNLYNFWWFPRIEPVITVMSFGNRLMPRILGFIQFIFYLYLYNYFKPTILASKFPSGSKTSET